MVILNESSIKPLSAKIKRIFAAVFLSWFFIYALTAVVIIKFTNFDLIKTKKLDFYNSDALYPLDYLKKKAPYDKVRFSAALHYYKILTEVSSRSSRAWGTLGLCYYYLGSIKQAENCYQKAVLLTSPEYFEFHYDLGIFYFRQGKYMKAAELFKEAIQRAEERLKQTTFSWASEQGMDAQSSAFMRFVMVQTSTAYVNANKMLIVCYDKLGSFSEEKKTAVNVLRLQFSSEPEVFLYFAGLASFHLNDYKESEAFFYQCLSKNPNFTLAYHYLELIYKTTHRDGMVEQVSQQARSLKDLKSLSEFQKELEVPPDLILDFLSYLKPLTPSSVISNQQSMKLQK